MPPSCSRRGRPVVLAGDYNVMPTELDVYKPERWLDDALFRAEVRDAFRRLVAQGWTDALRALHPDERIYTFWDYFRNAWAPQRRPAHRPPAAQPVRRRPPRFGGRRPRGARLGEGERPRARLDRARRRQGERRCAPEGRPHEGWPRLIARKAVAGGSCGVFRCLNVPGLANSTAGPAFSRCCYRNAGRTAG